MKIAKVAMVSTMPIVEIVTGMMANKEFHLMYYCTSLDYVVVIDLVDCYVGIVWNSFFVGNVIHVQ